MILQTVSTLSTFVLAMTQNPDIQAKAQRELESVLGPDRMPTFEDKDSLPYLTAIVKECLRWEPVAPVAIPHQCVQDDVYEGYHIPAGATVIANSW